MSTTPETRFCMNCHRSIPYDPIRGPKQYSERMFCGRTCASEYRGKQSKKEVEENPRYCAYCGELLVIKPTEYPYHYRRRRTCNRKCGNALRSREMTGVKRSRLPAKPTPTPTPTPPAKKRPPLTEIEPVVLGKPTKEYLMELIQDHHPELGEAIHDAVVHPNNKDDIKWGYNNHLYKWGGNGL